MSVQHKQDGFGFKIEGLAELVKQLEHLDGSGARAAMRVAIRAGSRPVVRAARANLQKNSSVRTGQLRKSIGVKIKFYKKTGTIAAIIGPRRGFKTTVVTERGESKNNDPSKYAHLVEGGHVMRRVKGGPIVGHVMGKPFLGPALESNVNLVTDEMTKKLATEIPKQALKYARRRR